LWEPESGIFLLNEHMQRLGKSAAYFDVPLDVYAIQDELDQVVSEFDAMPHRIRLLVSRDGAFEVQCFPMERGRACSPHRFARVPSLAGSAPPVQSEADGRTVRRTVPTLRMALANEPVDSQNIFLFHKTTHRDIYEMAKADYPDCDEVILWNDRGEVTEGCITNVVIRKAGKLITPPIECGLLAGTFRAHLLKSGEIEEGIVTVEELRSAEEVFLVSSVRKWHKAVWA